MNENAQDWVAALRSGEFQQTTGSLKDDEGFCCLGVACELYRRAHEDVAHWRKRITSTAFTVDGHSSTGSLPDPVKDWLGLRNENGVFFNSTGGMDHELKSLVGQNDTNKLPFNEIADLIEKHWKMLGAKP